VRTHVRNAMKKTGARTRAQLVALVLADGLIEE
jgi:DNA-binding CsgD family transcriptional regulator